MTSSEAFREDQECRPRDKVLLLPSNNGKYRTDQQVKYAEDDPEFSPLENAPILCVLHVFGLKLGSERLNLGRVQSLFHKL